MPHAVVSERQRSKAKQLRRAMTRAETLLWRYLTLPHKGGGNISTDQSNSTDKSRGKQP
jgi:very-short-patch-repair endonuclease